ncbi:MAG: 1-acyl-sn-glycerol-3-phosphate acyltransferase [Pseudobacteriovorax sp.]|nr:1-acyl-sn-glycerol-3-phosphate acyltransferase [Pseudobacteriovorax sp.]
MKYRIRNLSETRRLARKLIEEAGDKPIIIVSNHLTLIDSWIITWSLFDIKRFVSQFKVFPWNVPEIRNFGRNIPLRLMCYLGKCVYVERQGRSKSRTLTMNKLKFLLSQGQSLCIFPEGGRSRIGRIDLDATTYGVGSLIRENPECTILATYCRGESQKEYSNFPKHGEEFQIMFEELSIPGFSCEGKRYDKEVSLYIMQKLKEMEEQYFSHRERHRRFA